MLHRCQMESSGEFALINERLLGWRNGVGVQMLVGAGCLLVV